MPDTLTPEEKAAAEAEAARKAAAETEAVSIPTPAKGADFDTIAAQHNDLVREGRHEVAAAFHKKYVLGYKGK